MGGQEGSVSKPEASNCFAAFAAKQLGLQLSVPLDTLNIPLLPVDRVHSCDSAVLIALCIAAKQKGLCFRCAKVAPGGMPRTINPVEIRNSLLAA